MHLKSIPYMADKHSNRLFPLLSSLQRPLSFASKDDFAHLETIKGLEHLVETVCNEADELIKRDCFGAEAPRNDGEGGVSRNDAPTHPPDGYPASPLPKGERENLSKRFSELR